MTTEISVQGHCEAQFGRVEDALASNFSRDGELGAAVAVYLDGASVVDLWTGYMNAARTRPWEKETLVLVFSVTKGLVALCAHMLVDRGLIDLGAPVAQHWPEFKQSGKGKILVRELLSHQAGLAAISKPLPPGSEYQWEAMTAALAEQEPLWESGTQFGYHLLTYGWLVGEVIRRVSGKSLGTFLRDEVARPLGVDFFLGLPATEEARTAETVPGPQTFAGEGSLVRQVQECPESLLVRMFQNPPPSAENPSVTWNSREFRAAELPSSNGHGTARAVARVYAALAVGGALDGVRLLSRTALEQATAEAARGTDVVTGTQGRVALGFLLPHPESWPFSPSPRAFGHPGFGGSIGFADPEARLSFAYTLNQLGPGALRLDPRAKRLIDAVYACL
jgi:CubicO group peptidase (beta-lactamase class C family)